MMRADTRCDCVRSAMIDRMIPAKLFSRLAIPTVSGLVHGRLMRFILAKTAVSGNQPQ
jgi:hypothetical protein